MMSHSSTDTPATNNTNQSTNESQETWHTFASDTTNAIHAAASTTTPSSPEAAPSWWRDRRVFSRAAQRPRSPTVRSSSGSNASASSGSFFNPQASEFVPTMVAPSKRKVSSSAVSGRSMPSSFRPLDTNTLTASPQEFPPIIKAKDLQGRPDAGTATLTDFASELHGGPVAGTSTFTNFALDLDGNWSGAESDEDFLDFGQDNNIWAHGPPPATANNAPLTHTRRPVYSAGPSYGMRSTQIEPPKRDDVIPVLSSVLLSRGADSAAPAKYLPLCSLKMQGRGRAPGLLTVLPTYLDRIDHLQRGVSQFCATWPAKVLPLEIFDLITEHLAREDIKNMRLVNRELESKVSASLFRTCVVPFNTELYDMIDDEAKTKIQPPSLKVKSQSKGKGRATESDGFAANAEPVPLPWQNAKEDKEGKVYKGHGLKVFQGFGPHIKRFGMSFEVSESQLSQPLAKKELNYVDSYHSSYFWPPPGYTRFAGLAGLEHIADETSRMKSAFEKLSVVQELGLSVDSGLGWLSGLDKSVRAHVFERPTAVFGRSSDVPEHQAQVAAEFWAALQASQASFPSGLNAKEVTLACRELTATSAELDGLKGTHYADTEFWPSVDSAKAMPHGAAKMIDNHLRVLYTTTAAMTQSTTALHARAAVVPSNLRKEQKEWLLETEWAQRAFLESYMLAVVDNPAVFGKVTVLNIAKFSSGFLPLIENEPFWEALPALRDLTLHVSPDWRSVAKDDAGFAELTHQSPSWAVTLFYGILKRRLSKNETITKLNIGWVVGGEHAEGIFARNTSILPAPITPRDYSTANTQHPYSLVFDYVEHLTLANCWLTPPVLEGLVKNHADKALTKLTLDSVSLTAHPRNPPGGHQGGAQLVGQMIPANAGAPQANIFNGQQMQLMPPMPPMPQVQPMQPIPPAQAFFQAWNGGIQAYAPQNPVAQHQLQMHQQALHMQQLQQIQHMQQLQQLPQLPQAHPNNLFNAGQQHMPLLNAANFPPLPGFAAAPFQAAAPPAPHARWTDGHRRGSWPAMLNIISPGPTFSDYLETPAPWEEPLPPRPTTQLRTIEFVSCGYAKILHNPPFDQQAIEADWLQLGHTTSAWFRMRQTALKPSMMASSDPKLAQIVQHMPWRELNALQLGWGLTEGWQDRQKAEEAEWDGCLPGGTGRFSGVVHEGMRLASAPQL